MLNKIKHILLALAVMVTTTGISVTRHYCDNRLMFTSVNSLHTNCGMTHCRCHNETKYLKVKDDFKATISNANFYNYFVNFVGNIENGFATISESSTLFRRAESPPGDHIVLLAFLKTFRI